MKKIFLLICLLFFSLEAVAHPGKTDSVGGHVDNSIGEYHFHHGYPEHQHTDGVCPYDYVNAEEDNYRDEKNDISSSSKITKSKSNTVLKENGNIKNSFWKDNTTLQAAITILVIFTLPSAIKEILNRVKEKNEWKKQRKHYYSMYANIDPVSLVDIPKEVYFKNGIPITDGHGKYGRYTVYITSSGKYFHQDARCCSKTIEKHIFEVAKSHKPCSKCVLVPFPEYKWFIEYRKIVKIKEKYNIP